MNFTNYVHTLNVSNNNGAVFTSWIIFFLGISSICLNVFVVVTIVLHRRIVLKNVFYMLVLHCSFVDVIRALALSVWCLPALNIFPMTTVAQLTQLKSWMVVVLRSLNMLTILNLLVFTINEFIVVLRPLQYRRIRRKRIVFAFVALSWALSFGFTIGNVVAKNYGPQNRSVYVLKTRNRTRGVSDVSNESRSAEIVSEGGTPVSNVMGGLCNDSLDNMLSKNDDNSTDCVLTNWLARQRQNFDEFHYPFLFALIVICVVCLVSVFACYAMILKRIHNFKHCNELKTAADDSKSNTGVVKWSNNNSSNSSATARRKRSSLLVRHKYVLVIGSVLVVDILFLVPYSIVQVLQYVYLSKGVDVGPTTTTSSWSAHPRLILQFIIGLHSVLQPFCYFRMEDFRRLAKFKKLPSGVKETNTLTNNNNNRAVLFNRHSNDFDLDYTESSSKKYVYESPAVKSPEMKFVYNNKSQRSYCYSAMESRM